jgi:hypothetical protein
MCQNVKSNKKLKIIGSIRLHEATNTLLFYTGALQLNGKNGNGCVTVAHNVEFDTYTAYIKYITVYGVRKTGSATVHCDASILEDLWELFKKHSLQAQTYRLYNNDENGVVVSAPFAQANNTSQISTYTLWLSMKARLRNFLKR